jgi:hypothetical protein
MPEHRADADPGRQPVRDPRATTPQTNSEFRNRQPLERSVVEMTGGPRDQQSNTSKAGAEFEFAAEVSLDDWLSRTVGWYSGQEA